MTMEDEKNFISGTPNDSTGSPFNKTSTLFSKLESGIKEAMNSERYKAFLKMQTYFHGYSFNNSMLIYLQRPDATRVAGFNTWKKLERHVIKGEMGIMILAPDPYKYYKWVDKLDPKTKESAKDPVTGNVLKVKTEVTGLSFKPVTVFDVKQTDGKELPEICSELKGDSINAESIIRAIKHLSSIPVVEKDILNGAKGYYSRSEGIIAIQQGMSLDQTANTLIHEYAHSLLHSSEAGAALSRETKEVQAESVAYIVSERFGVDTSEYSFDYLANWSNGKELPELKKSFDTIQKCSNEIIVKMENVLTKEIELHKTKQIESITNDIPSYKIFYSVEQDKEAISFQKDTGYNRIWIPESQGANGDTWVVYKSINDLPKWVQEFARSMENSGQNVSEKGISVKDKIVAEYSNEFPAIKHISGKTANFIESINKNRESNITIQEIKNIYKETGKRLEVNTDQSVMEEFGILNNVVDDIKHAQLKEKKVQAQEKAEVKQICKDMDMVR